MQMLIALSRLQKLFWELSVARDIMLRSWHSYSPLFLRHPVVAGGKRQLELTVIADVQMRYNSSWDS